MSEKKDTKQAKEITNKQSLKMLNNSKFGQNAHRAIIKDRDTAAVVTPKVSDKIMESILSDYRIPVRNVNTSVKKKEAPAKRVPISVVPNNGKSLIDFICEADGDSYISDTNGIIVTMTSWVKRINNVEKTLKTILGNTEMPEKIIINLTTEEFPNKENSLPSGLVNLANMNSIIEFHWLKHNTTVWKKIIPTLIRFKNANIICIDDDRLYPKDFIATFKNALSKYPSGPITGANISFYKKYKQHCGHATLDKYAFYKDGLDFITKEVMDLKSSDSVLTVIANRTGHPTQYLGVNYLSKIPQNNNPVAGYSSNEKISVSSAIKKADSIYDSYTNKTNGNKKVTINALITTYNRIKETKALVEQLLSYRGEKYEINITIWDDCLTNRFNYESPYVKVFHNKENRGRKKFWITWNEMFAYCKENRAMYYLFLQDDHILRENFFDIMLETWQKLESPISLAPLIEDSAIERGKSRWGEKPHKKLRYDAMKTQWFDCNGLVTDKFFEALDWKLTSIPESRWNSNPLLSSGVGQQITTRLQAKNKNMYHMAPTMILLHDIKSEMNAKERAKNALETHVDKQIDLLNNKTNIIVSLTSYKARLPYITPVIDSILNGTFLPQKIVLTLYDKDVAYIPKEVKKYITDGVVELITTNDDIKPHKKYFYVMQKYRENPIVTIDDDIVYTEDLLESLNESYKKYPNCVSARRVRYMKYDANGFAANYNTWKLQKVKLHEPSFDLFATGCGGILYPPNILKIEDSMISSVRKCIMADDILLNWRRRNLGIKIAFVFTGGKYWKKEIDNDVIKKTALFATNKTGGNDKCLEIFKIKK